MSCHVMSCHVMSCHVMSCKTLFNHGISFFILGVDRVQNLAKYNRRLRVFMQLTQKNIAINTNVIHT